MQIKRPKLRLAGAFSSQPRSTRIVIRCRGTICSVYKYFKKGLIFRETYSIIVPVEQTESCPSWSKEHDWKSCKRSTPFQEFESLTLRQEPMEVKHFCRFFLSVRCRFSRRRNPPSRPLVDEIFLNLPHGDHRGLQLSFCRQKSFLRDLCLFFFTHLLLVQRVCYLDCSLPASASLCLHGNICPWL